MTLTDLMNLLLQVLAYGGGGAVVAYGIFKYTGEKWIENKFAERLAAVRHQQALELQRLKVEIDALLSGAIRLQEREFQILPEAWAKLDEAHARISTLCAPFQEYPNIERMDTERLTEFIASSELVQSDKNELLRTPPSGRNQLYQRTIVWYRLDEARKAFAALQIYVARNGIFLSPELKDKFAKIAETLWQAIVSKKIGHEAQDWKIQGEGWEKIKKETDPLYKAIETEIQARLQGHGRKP